MVAWVNIQDVFPFESRHVGFLLLFYGGFISTALDLLFLCRFLSAFGDGLAADPPVVGADFFDNDNGGGGVFAEDVDEELGGSLDELGFLFRRRAVGSDLDVYEWHGCFNLSYIENILPGLG